MKFAQAGLPNSADDISPISKNSHRGALQKSKLSSTTRGTNTRYGNFSFQLNPVGLMSGANPNKYNL